MSLSVSPVLGVGYIYVWNVGTYMKKRYISNYLELIILIMIVK